MTLSRWITDIIWHWQRKHPPLKANRAWRQAHEEEARALRRGCTQALHRARQAKREAINRDLLKGCDPRTMGMG